MASHTSIGPVDGAAVGVGRGAGAAVGAGAAGVVVRPGELPKRPAPDGRGRDCSVCSGVAMFVGMM